MQIVPGVQLATVAHAAEQALPAEGGAFALTAGGKGVLERATMRSRKERRAVRKAAGAGGATFAGLAGQERAHQLAREDVRLSAEKYQLELEREKEQLKLERETFSMLLGARFPTCRVVLPT